MLTQEAIRTRRSIRRYTGEPVTGEQVDLLLEAAFVAPSAFDERPWHFVTVTQRDVLDELAGAMPGCDMLREATLGLLICGEPALEKFPNLWIQDCSACAQNVLLSAHAQGLGAVWLALYPIDDRQQAMRNRLGIPDAIVPFALIALGHPAETLPGENRFDASRLHRETW